MAGRACQRRLGHDQPGAGARSDTTLREEAGDQRSFGVGKRDEQRYLAGERISGGPMRSMLPMNERSPCPRMWNMAGAPTRSAEIGSGLVMAPR